MNKYLLLLMTLVLSGCDWGLGSTYSSTTKTAYIDYYQEACSADGTDMCFRMRFDTDDEFEINTLPVSGFDDLELGKRYTIQVEAERDSSGDDTSYALVSIDSEDAIDAETNHFVLTFSMSSQILLENSDTSWIIAAEDVFTCVEADCIALANSYNENEQVQLTFSASNDELTLVEFSCSAAVNDFASDCEGVNDNEWNIAHYQTDCGLFEPRLCLVYRDSDSSSNPWNILPFDITDFTAEWGTEYELDVKVTTESGSIKSASLVSEESMTNRQTDNFIVVMRTGVKGVSESASGILTYDEVTFNCSENGLCSDIDDEIEEANSDSEIIIAVQVIANGQEDHVIEELICSAESGNFQDDCADEYDEIIWVETTE